ncbi:helix-turn-helix domain-containing protein [Trabulsiella odontotermitis]|uniref:Transcriptional regulator n=1 Tax=Trabulsiella odontotermitis TaxID=379893 RepID=A0A0L0GML1_9ENTR|nr:helix-turn-helix domain-containing protein [Trabulsiella odontotermitis]KNC89638.1 transcriptional regulator [Trabulsiella odontotermitis]
MQLLRQDLADLFVEIGRDWPSGAVILALKRKGVTLGDIESDLGVKEGSVRNVFYRKCDRYEAAIAQKIGVTPDLIWPSRYPSEARLSA